MFDQFRECLGWEGGGVMELGTESCMQGEYTQVRSISNETQPMDHRSGLVTPPKTYNGIRAELT